MLWLHALQFYDYFNECQQVYKTKHIEITLALLTWVTQLMYSACAHYVFDRITFQSRYMRSMPAALPSHFGRGSGLVTGLTLALRIFGDAKA